MQKKYQATLLGLAIGDALGVPVEFCRPGTFAPVTTFQDSSFRNTKKGQWSDDTSMALCLATSLIECNGFNPQDQMDRYYKWYSEGYLSSTGTCFDIGNTILKALQTYKKTNNPYAGSTNPATAGNGSLMRLAPIPMFYRDIAMALDMATKSSKTTHAAPETIDACRYYTYLIRKALDGKTKEEILTPITIHLHDVPLVPEIAEIALGSFKTKMPPQIEGTGYVVKSLEAALWAFHHSHTFAEGALLAVNLGNDSDTTGAIYGQLAGAYYGMEGLPKEWVEELSHSEMIIDISNKLFEASKTVSLTDNISYHLSKWQTKINHFITSHP